MTLFPFYCSVTNSSFCSLWNITLLRPWTDNATMQADVYMQEWKTQLIVENSCALLNGLPAINGCALLCQQSSQLFGKWRDLFSLGITLGRSTKWRLKVWQQRVQLKQILNRFLVVLIGNFWNTFKKMTLAKFSSDTMMHKNFVEQWAGLPFKSRKT